MQDNAFTFFTSQESEAANLSQIKGNVGDTLSTGILEEVISRERQYKK